MLKTGDSGVREMKKIKVITLFTGIGAQEAALKRLEIDYEVVGISEIDKYAIQSYEAINGSTYNYGDITKINALDYADLWTYSSPCQDFSTAGKQQGIRNSDGSLTRSGLLLHVERLLVDSVIRGDNPKYLLMENVKGLVSKKFKPDFDRWLERLEQLGYNNYWQVLNAKDYGVPQNRERVFVVSIRKDVDTKGYKFPEKIPPVKRLKDVLESVVDEKYYLSQDKVDKLVMNNDIKVKEIITSLISKQGTKLEKYTSIANTLMARDYKGFGNQGMNGIIEPVICASRGRNPDNPSDRTTGAPTEQRLEINQTGCTNTLTTVQKDNYLLEPSGLYIHDSDRFRKKPLKGLSRCLKAEKHDAAVIQVGNIVDTGNWDNPQRGRIYSPSGCSPALTTMQGGGLEPKILFIGGIGEPTRLKDGKNLSRNYKQGYRVYDSNGISTAIVSSGVGGVGGATSLYTTPKVIQVGNIVEQYRIRKLTPRECWRLMGFTDVEFDCAQMSGISNTQLYKQAGNSIVVDVLVGIFKELLS